MNPDIQIVGADPEGSVYSGGSGRPYLVEGIGEDFWPTTYDPTVVDKVVMVSDTDSFLTARRFSCRRGNPGRWLHRDGDLRRTGASARSAPPRRRCRAHTRLGARVPVARLLGRVDGGPRFLAHDRPHGVGGSRAQEQDL